MSLPQNVITVTAVLPHRVYRLHGITVKFSRSPGNYRGYTAVLPLSPSPCHTLVCTFYTYRALVSVGGGCGRLQHAGPLLLPGGRQRAGQRSDAQPWTGDEGRVATAFRPRRRDVCGTVPRSDTLPTRSRCGRRVQVRRPAQYSYGM